jgi:hypothetical protein
MNNSLEIKSSWEMVWTEYIDDIIDFISVLGTREEVAVLIEKDHHAETLKWKDVVIDGL